MYFSSLLFVIYSILLSITLYAFQYTVLLNLSLNNFNNFTLSSADKVTIGKKRFASVILKIAVLAVVSKHFSIEFNESSILQLINGISSDLQKLLKHFNGTAIFTRFFIPLLSVLPIILALYLNEEELILVPSALLSILSLSKSHKLPDVSE